MKVSLLLFLPLASLASATYKPPKCTSNNCARAVTGFPGCKSPPQTARKADCSSFIKCTLTPATKIITVYKTNTATSLVTKPITKQKTITTAVGTITVTSTEIIPLRKRSVPKNTPILKCPSKIPTYAGRACGYKPAEYSSACSCLSIRPKTITLPSPTRYTTKTVSKTITITASTIVTITNTATVPAATETKLVCMPNRTLCPGATECTNLFRDPQNCGACNSPCPNGWTCFNAQCQEPVD